MIPDNRKLSLRTFFQAVLALALIFVPDPLAERMGGLWILIIPLAALTIWPLADLGLRGLRDRLHFERMRRRQAAMASLKKAELE